jgi:hypothetical protein
MPFKHEKFVAKVREENPHHFRGGERVEDAVPGQTRTLETALLGVLMDLYRRLTGKLGPRLIILTDRNLYLAATGTFAPWKIKEVKVRYPRSEAGAHLRAASRLSVVVDGERIVVQSPLEKHLRALVKAAGGAELTTADKVREVKANVRPERVLVGIVIAVLVVLFVRSAVGFAVAVAVTVAALLFFFAQDRRESARNKDR